MEIAFLIINSIAIIVIPIVAVLIAQRLQTRSAKRKDKIDIFKTLVATNVYGWGGSFRAVDALNSIPVIFADNEEVVKKYLAYIKSCKIEKEELIESRRKEIETNTIKLLEEMSKVLGYKNEWHVFTETYLPSGVVNELLNEKKYKDSQLAVGSLAENFLTAFSSQQLQVKGTEEKRNDKQ